jgi:hypothetical protein
LRDVTTALTTGCGSGFAVCAAAIAGALDQVEDGLPLDSDMSGQFGHGHRAGVDDPQRLLGTQVAGKRPEVGSLHQAGGLLEGIGRGQRPDPRSLGLEGSPEMYASRQHTIREIAETFGVSHMTVYRSLQPGATARAASCDRGTS